MTAVPPTRLRSFTKSEVTGLLAPNAKIVHEFRTCLACQADRPSSRAVRSPDTLYREHSTPNSLEPLHNKHLKSRRIITCTTSSGNFPGIKMIRAQSVQLPSNQHIQKRGGRGTVIDMINILRPKMGTAQNGTGALAFCSPATPGWAARHRPSTRTPHGAPLLPVGLLHMASHQRSMRHIPIFNHLQTAFSATPVSTSSCKPPGGTLPSHSTSGIRDRKLSSIPAPSGEERSQRGRALVVFGGHSQPRLFRIDVASWCHRRASRASHPCGGAVCRRKRSRASIPSV